MGRPKSLLADGAGSVLERIVAILKVHARRVLLAGRGPVPATLADLDRLMDVPSVEGPLAGILSAVRWHPSARWIVLACDLPLVEADAVQWLLSQTRLGADAVMPRLDPEAPCEPLFAVYEPTCLPRLEGAALEGTWSLRRALGGGRTLQPVVPTPLRSAWTNVNTLAEWEATRRSMDEGHCG